MVLQKPGRLLSRSILGLLVAFASACGQSPPSLPSSTTSPTTQAPPAVSSIAVVGPHVLPTDSDVVYWAKVTLPNAASLERVRGVQWNSDNIEVASVRSANDGAGELNARREGLFTLTATYQGASASLPIEVRVPGRRAGGAHLEISHAPNPVPASPTPCAGFPSTPTWTFAESVAETQGVGFTLQTVSFAMYSDSGAVIYSDTFVENDHIAAHASLSEDLCMFLFGSPSGYYSSVYEGIDESGNPLAFAADRLRFLPLGAGPSLNGGASLLPAGRVSPRTNAAHSDRLLRARLR